MNSWIGEISTASIFDWLYGVLAHCNDCVFGWTIVFVFTAFWSLVIAGLSSAEKWLEEREEYFEARKKYFQSQGYNDEKAELLAGLDTQQKYPIDRSLGPYDFI